MPAERARRLPQRWGVAVKAVATMIITMIPLTTTLAGCGSAARVAPPGPLQVLNAAVTMAPASYTGLWRQAGHYVDREGQRQSQQSGRAGAV